MKQIPFFYKSEVNKSYGYTQIRNHISVMRIRTKECYYCKEQKEVLFRCRYDELKDWVFLCGNCLTKVKSQYDDTYQYGGTWKSKKK